jgi:hypothetical protein
MPVQLAQTVKDATLSAKADDGSPASGLRRELLRRFMIGPLWLSVNFIYAPALVGVAEALPRGASAAVGNA